MRFLKFELGETPAALRIMAGSPSRHSLAARYVDSHSAPPDGRGRS